MGKNGQGSHGRMMPAGAREQPKMHCWKRFWGGRRPAIGAQRLKSPSSLGQPPEMPT